MIPTRSRSRGWRAVIATLVALTLSGLVSCGDGREPAAALVTSTAGLCTGLTGEAFDFAQRALDSLADSSGLTSPDPAEQATFGDLMQRADDAGCARSAADFTGLVCPGVDELTATGAAAEAELANLIEACDWSPDPADADRAALAACEPAAGEAVASPIPETEGEGLLTEALDPFLAEGFRHADERFELRDGAAAHHLTLNWAADGIVQSLTRDSVGRAATWTEFHWDDPVWSARSESEPWSSREEPGAFEPPYRFAFSSAVQAPTAVAGSADLDPVFEKAVEHGGTELLQFCIDGAVGLSYGASSGLAATRFLAHPDGYVVEFVEASVGSFGRFCYESTLQLGDGIVLPGLDDSPPPDHVVDLVALPGCSDLVEGR